MATTRNVNGRFRAKNGSTRIGNIEKQYKVNLHVRSDMKLSTYLERQGVPSLGKALDMVQRTPKK